MLPCVQGERSYFENRSRWYSAVSGLIVVNSFWLLFHVHWALVLRVRNILLNYEVKPKYPHRQQTTYYTISVNKTIFRDKMG